MVGMKAPGARRAWFDRWPAGVITTLGFVVLGPLAGVLVLVAIPDAFGIESSCVTATGAVTTAGDSYVAAFAVLGSVGWLAVFLGVIFAGIVERPAVGMLLPALWFAVLVSAALVAAAAIGPAPCPA
jgi:hypothetical protein